MNDMETKKQLTGLSTDDNERERIVVSSDEIDEREEAAAADEPRGR